MKGTKEMENRSLTYIRLLRAVGAVSVLLYHMNVYVTIIHGENTTFTSVFDTFFSYGALLFITISGFLMSRILENGYPYFLIRRLLRIYPMYWLVVMLSLFVRVIVLDGVSYPTLGRALTLLPFGDVSYALGIEWTLIYEVFYYCVCFLFNNKYMKKLYPAFLVVWGIIILVADYKFQMGTYFVPTWRQIFFAQFNFSFILGALIYYLCKHVTLKKLWINYLLVILSVVGIFYAGYAGWRCRYYIFALALAIIVWSFNSVEACGGLYCPRWILTLGDSSYTLYLVHVSLFIVVYSRFAAYMTGMLCIMIQILAVVLSVLSGLGLAKVDTWIAKNINSRLRKRLNY